MWIAVPITNENSGIFYYDLNELLAKNEMPKQNITGHMPLELKKTRITIAPSSHPLNSNLESLL